MEVYGQDYRCFPVTLSPDGTEIRLECPRMGDEEEIEGWCDVGGVTNPPTQTNETLWLLLGADSLCFGNAPTPEHYPRLSLEGVWVWSTRR